MRDEPGMTFQPRLHFLVLVGAVVIHDQMERNIAAKLLIEPAQELQKLLMPVALMAFADDLTLYCFQCRKQGRRSIAFVVMSHGSATSLFDRQPRLSPIEGLYLA